MKETETSSLPTQRSWLSAYGTPLALLFVILTVGVVIFSSMPAAVSPPKTEATPAMTEKEYYAKKTQNTDTLIKKAVEQSGGNWNKIPAVGQQRIQEISQGHGKEMVEMYFQRLQEEKKQKKQKSKKS